MTDDQFLASFNDCTLPKEHFNHLGHVRLAWIQLRRHAFEDAVLRTCGGIQAYASHLGAAGKFHWTITEALMHLLRAAGAAEQHLDWPEFLAANADLIGDARGRVARHYSAQLLATEDARARFVTPDLLPLPAAKTA
ncbi:MAG: hypothetical protein V4508_18500 [Pseudomonadota bacterium]